ncbi:Csu type fimbrial protein [Glacieibacterium megasporae]|uniref:Csu type fimbrial protein n=1 Tax=Glacieibacterium megasporae TaxID=2835787 RepID=UPI001C1DE35C|nr:spore coat U domain-containing protein [Polymorphobacter megasporae]UAJ10464.1 spore coat U domain-containing protein [Polymorphobacter megasporae]
MIAALVGICGVPGTAMAACLVVATPMIFGTLNLIGNAANDAAATITVTCGVGTSYNVGLDNGANFSATRRMKSATAAAYVPYSLYSDSLRATPWGNTIGSNTVAGTAGVLPTILSVYGRVPAGTVPVPVDAYLDVITVTITF